MDWIGSSMNNMQIKRDSEGHLKGGDQGTSAMGVKGVKGGGGQDASRARVLEFLQRHTAYELIPESAKVVVLDTKLPVRKAFHACYEQGITAAPLWDSMLQAFVGMMTASEEGSPGPSDNRTTEGIDVMMLEQTSARQPSNDGTPVTRMTSHVMNARMLARRSAETTTA